MKGRLDFALSLVALFFGFAVPLWPLVVAGTLGSVVSGHLFAALIAAFLFDLLFGPWPALFYAAFPMTLFVTAASILALFMRRYLRTR